MKKLLIAILAITVIGTGALAADSAAWSGESLDGTTGTPMQKVSLSLDSMESFSIGFSSDGNPVNDGTEVSTTVLAPSATDSTIADNSAKGSELYVWWDITTAGNVKVSISKSGDLKAGDEEDAPTIKWSVTGADAVYSSPVSKIEIGTEGTSDDLISLSASENKLQHTDGSQQLFLETESLTGKPTGTDYTASLTLAITNQL